MTKSLLRPETKTTLQAFTVLERAVLYARTSGDDTRKDGRNINGQLDDCRAYALEKGYSVVAEIKEDDRGASGYELDLPGINRVLDMAEAGEFDVLVVREVDRLARNRTKKAVIKETLRRANIRIDYVLQSFDDDPYGRFSENVMDDIAELEREIITMRMVRGRRKKIKAGSIFVSGRAPYGYQIVEHDGKSGLEVVEEEAQIVRLIYQWYISGDEAGKRLSAYSIARKLTKMGVLTRGDESRLIKRKKMGKGEWANSTINYILHNETYAGVWHYSKKNKPITLEVPAIIARELWEAAQVIFAKNKRNSKGNTRHEYLFSRRCTCGSCGYKMVSRPNRSKNKLRLYYVCPTFHPDYTRECDLPHFRVEEVDALVWNWLESIFTDPLALEKSLADRQAEKDEENAPLFNLLESTECLIKRNESELAQLLKDLRAIEKRNSPRAKTAILDEIEQIEKKLDGLETQRTTLTTRLEAHALTEEQMTELKAYAALVAQDLDTIRGDFESRRRLIEMFNVQLTLKVEAGEKVIYVSCHFGEKSLYFQQEPSSHDDRDENCESGKKCLSIKCNSNNFVV